MRLNGTTMKKTNKTKLLQLLSRLWNGSNSVLAGKHAEQKMISILRNRFPQAQLIEVTDVSGKNYFILYISFEKRESFLKNVFSTDIFAIVL